MRTGVLKMGAESNEAEGALIDVLFPRERQLRSGIQYIGSSESERKERARRFPMIGVEILLQTTSVSRSDFRP